MNKYLNKVLAAMATVDNTCSSFSVRLTGYFDRNQKCLALTVKSTTCKILKTSKLHYGEHILSQKLQNLQYKNEIQ